jgi:metallo-beta-lactamase family protein
MRLTFHGAAGEVTGSCLLVETEHCRFLVDCGLFQGDGMARARNAADFPFDPAAIDFVVLTHAHVDHSGRLPLLCKRGFTGPIFATEATRALCEVMLADSGHLHERDAERENRRAAREGRPETAEPLYTSEEGLAAVESFESLAYDAVEAVHDRVNCRLSDAGHILGSAIVELWVREGATRTRLVSTGDLGQPNRPILRDPSRVAHADVLCVESTYGDRPHRSMDDTLAEMHEAIHSTISRGGNVIIPAFTVGRTQELLYHLMDGVRTGALPHCEVSVDSPMATAATAITLKHFELFDREARELAAWRRDHPDTPTIRFIATPEESQLLNTRSGQVIVAASGMCTGGRVLHHLRHNLPRPDSTVLFVGWQAEGTLGRRLVDGARQVRIHGGDVTVLGGFSAHADQPALLEWMGALKEVPSQTFVMHGELFAAHALEEAISDRFGWTRVTIPTAGTPYDVP